MTRNNLIGSDPKLSRQSRELYSAIFAAAVAVGADGHGRDGLEGYLARFAADCPREFAPLLARAPDAGGCPPKV